MTSLRDEAVEAVLELERRHEDAPMVPTVTEYVDAVLDVVVLRLTAVVLDLAARRELTPAGARAVHKVLDTAGVTA